MTAMNEIEAPLNAGMGPQSFAQFKERALELEPYDLMILARPAGR